MPERATIKKARRDLKRGRAASTAAGEFVREEVHHIRKGKHGARSTKQAIAIGLSKARRAGVPLPAPKNGTKRTKAAAKRALVAGRTHHEPSRRRGRAALKALEHEPRSAASHRSLSAQARKAARTRTRHA
jgi:hypothetical protein